MFHRYFHTIRILMFQMRILLPLIWSQNIYIYISYSLIKKEVLLAIFVNRHLKMNCVFLCWNFIWTMKRYQILMRGGFKNKIRVSFFSLSPNNMSQRTNAKWKDNRFAASASVTKCRGIYNFTIIIILTISTYMWCFLYLYLPTNTKKKKQKKSRERWWP